MKNTLKPQFRKNDILLQELVDETLVYDLNRNKAFCLNDTSASIWKLCDGTRTIKEIAAEVSKQSKTPVLEEVILLAIDQFKSDDLLESESIPESIFEGISRREVIRKVGIASAIALPIVSALVVPSAASAQSCLAPGSPCNFAAPAPLCCFFCSPIGSSFPGAPGFCM